MFISDGSSHKYILLLHQLTAWHTVLFPGTICEWCWYKPGLWPHQRTYSCRYSSWRKLYISETLFMIFCGYQMYETKYIFVRQSFFCKIYSFLFCFFFRDNFIRFTIHFIHVCKKLRCLAIVPKKIFLEKQVNKIKKTDSCRFVE